MSYLPTAEEICSTFHNFFENTVPNIKGIENFNSNLQNNDPILATVNSYDKRPSIERIKNRSCYSTFSFRKTSSHEVSKIIKNLNIKNIAWKVPWSGVFSGPSFRVFGLNTEIYGVNEHFSCSEMLAIIVLFLLRLSYWIKTLLLHSYLKTLTFVLTKGNFLMI